MSYDTLLTRLDGVKQFGPNRAAAKCPAHADGSPSLAIQRSDDGRILIHCFAGCEPSAVMDSLGLKMADLFPDKLPGHHYAPLKRGIPAAIAVAALRKDVLALAIIAENYAAGRVTAKNAVEYSDRAHASGVRLMAALRMADGG